MLPSTTSTGSTAATSANLQLTELQTTLPCCVERSIAYSGGIVPIRDTVRNTNVNGIHVLPRVDIIRLFVLINCYLAYQFENKSDRLIQNIVFQKSIQNRL